MDDDRALDKRPVENDEPPAWAASGSQARRGAPPVYTSKYNSFDAGSCLSNLLKLLGVVLIGGVIIVCLLAVPALGGINTSVGTVADWLNRILNAPAPTPVVPHTPTLLTLVQRYAMLEIVRYNYEKVVPVEFAQALGGVGGDKLLYIGVGYVSAGVDVADLDAGSIRVEATGSVSVTLPPARLTACVLDAQHSYIYRRDTGVFNFLTNAFNDEPDLLELAEREAISAFRESALESGILGRAQADAETHLRAILIAAGAKSVTFRTADGQPAHEPLCFSSTES